MDPQAVPAPISGQAPTKKSNKRLILIGVIVAVIIAGIVAYFVWYNLTGQAYWDGGQYAGQPVYDQTHGISRTLHFEFQACGLSDSDVTDAIHENQGGDPTLVTVMIGPNGSAASVNVSIVGDGVYSVTCQKL